MLNSYCSIIFAGISILATQPVFADDSRESLRCGSSVITIDSTAGEVLAKCGEPASGSRRELATIDGNRRYKTVINNEIEDWIFNFGPNQFQYQITFKNGRVKRIESLGKGY